MIVITGAAGFIGSALLSFLNTQLPEESIIIVDNFSTRLKDKNYLGKNWISCIDRNAFIAYLEENHQKVSFIFHLGARTDTLERDESIFESLNLNYSKKIWENCTRFQIPLIYASSAATYGNGQLGYMDDHQIVDKLQPLNAYGISKNDFDKWVLKQTESPPLWTGLKFFNVYGPNEYHKGRMASVVFHAFNQIRVNKKMNLFKSHRRDIDHGQQARDFIYVRDLLKVLLYIYDNQSIFESGIYNLGSAKANTFEDLTKAVFNAMGLQPNIDYVDMPLDMRENYQYYTCANMDKLKHRGYNEPFYTLEDGVSDYVQNYLLDKSYY